MLNISLKDTLPALNVAPSALIDLWHLTALDKANVLAHLAAVRHRCEKAVRVGLLMFCRWAERHCLAGHDCVAEMNNARVSH